MTNDDYQNAMDWVNKQPVNVVNLAIKSALQLAQEAEQVRKERDDYKMLYDEMVGRYTALAEKVRVSPTV